MAKPSTSNRYKEKVKERKRVKNTGHAGRSSKATIAQRNHVKMKYPIDAKMKCSLAIPEVFTTNTKYCEDMKLVELKLLNLYLDPDVKYLTNIQIGEIVGCNNAMVGIIRSSESWLRAFIEHSSKFLRNMVPDVMHSLQVSIREGDNTARLQWFKLMGWVDDTQNVLNLIVTGEQVNIGLTQSLDSLFGDTKRVEDAKMANKAVSGSTSSPQGVVKPEQIKNAEYKVLIDDNK